MVPKLRFKEFCGEWEDKRLGEIFKFMPTNSFSRNDLNYIEGDIYNIHYGDIHMIYPTITDAQKETFPYIKREKKLDVCSELLCEDGDVLLADASEDYDDIGKAIEIINVGDKKIVSGLHTIFMRDYKKIYANKFRGFMMNSNSVRKQIKVLAAGAKVLGISKSNIAKVKMPLPSLPEQTKIADFLSTVDDKIQNQQDKIIHLENIKKGFMQRIFSRKIRFKDDEGEEFSEWEEKKLHEFMIIPDKEKIDIIDNNKLLSVRLHLEGVEKNKNTSSLKLGSTIYYKRKSGQFIYGKQNFFNGAFGIIPKDLDGFLSSGDVPSLDIKKEKIIPQYLMYYMGRKCFYKAQEKLSAGTGSKRIHENTLLNIIIKTPCLKEQQKIADFLSSFDEKISIEKETLEHLKELKKGLLQQMFV